MLQEQTEQWAGLVLDRFNTLSEYFENNRPPAQDVLSNLQRSNPYAEFYLVDANGRILESGQPGRVEGELSVQTLRAFIDRTGTPPLLLENPNVRGAQQIFSAAPILRNGAVLGYFVIALNGKDPRSFANGSVPFLISESLLLALAVVIPAVLTALLLFRMILSPLKTIETRLTESQESSNRISKVSRGYELAELGLQIDRLIERINQSCLRLNERDYALQVMLTALSHDLRTPLMTMDFLLDELSHDIPADGNQATKSKLEAIRRQNGGLIQMINMTLEFASLQRPEYGLSLEPVAARQIVERSIRSVELKRAGLGNIQLRVSIDNDDLCQVDENLIVKALANLVDNALVHAQGATCILVKTQRRSSGVEFEVSDNGCGLPPSAREAILARQDQMPTASDALTRGTGLGLAIVRKILELHGSTLEVASGIAVGARFAFVVRAPSPARQHVGDSASKLESTQ